VNTTPPPGAPTPQLHTAVDYWYRVMVGYRARGNIRQAAASEAHVNRLLDYLCDRAAEVAPFKAAFGNAVQELAATADVPVHLLAPGCRAEP
jgi:hypothetical protein